jgi:hypothetical protein
LVWRRVFGYEVEREQILDVGLWSALGQLSEDMG